MSRTAYFLFILFLLGLMAGMGYAIYYVFVGGSKTYVQEDPLIIPTVQNNVASITFITSGKCIIPCSPKLIKLDIFDDSQTVVFTTLTSGFTTLQGPDSNNRWVGTVDLSSLTNLKKGWSYLGQATIKYGGYTTVGAQFPFMMTLPSH